jgi:hypothetical protein
MIRQAQCRSTRSTLDPPSDPLDPSALGHPRLGLDTLRVATAAALIDVFPRGVCVMRELLRACGRSLWAGVRFVFVRISGKSRLIRLSRFFAARNKRADYSVRLPIGFLHFLPRPRAAFLLPSSLSTSGSLSGRTLISHRST